MAWCALCTFAVPCIVQGNSVCDKVRTHNLTRCDHDKTPGNSASGPFWQKKNSSATASSERFQREGDPRARYEYGKCENKEFHCRTEREQNEKRADDCQHSYLPQVAGFQRCVEFYLTRRWQTLHA